MKIDRTPYEFSKETKLEALRRAEWKCEKCGKPKRECREGYLEIHHKLQVYLAIKYYPHIFPEVVASIDNAMVVCRDCHPHEDEYSDIHHKEIATALWQIYQAIIRT